MRRMAFVFAFAATVLLTAVAGAQQNYYRPLHLQDMVKAVGTNTEGMPPEELPKRITTYALHISDGDGVGVSARFAEDPNGAIIVGWRSGGRLWHYAWIEEAGLGVLEAFKPVDAAFVVETRHADDRITSVLLDADLDTVAVLDGRVQSVASGATPAAPLTVRVRAGTDERTLRCAVTVAPRRLCTQRAELERASGSWFIGSWFRVLFVMLGSWFHVQGAGRQTQQPDPCTRNPAPRTAP